MGTPGVPASAGDYNSGNQQRAIPQEGGAGWEAYTPEG